MNEGIQMYQCDSMTIYNPDFYNMTRLNFMYDRRRLYSRKKSQLEYNSHFPVDVVKERINFNFLYLSAYTFMDFSAVDFDFDIGFNNVEYNIEEKIINILEKEFGEIKILIKIYNSYENSNIIKTIEEKCNIVFSMDGVWKYYIIRLDNIEDIRFFDEDVCGILCGQEDSLLVFEEEGFDFSDLTSLQKIIDKFRMVMLRVPIYSNYNLMIYSKQKAMVDIISDRILDLKSDKFDIENISEVNNSQNFLLV